MQEHCGLIKINVTASFKDTGNSAQLSSDRLSAGVNVYLDRYIVRRASTLAAVVEV